MIAHRDMKISPHCFDTGSSPQQLPWLFALFTGFSWFKSLPVFLFFFFADPAKSSCEGKEPCLNGGVCLRSETFGSFKCFCRGHYRGSSCEKSEEFLVFFSLHCFWWLSGRVQTLHKASFFSGFSPLVEERSCCWCCFPGIRQGRAITACGEMEEASRCIVSP